MQKQRWHLVKIAVITYFASTIDLCAVTYVLTGYTSVFAFIFSNVTIANYSDFKFCKLKF